MQIGETETTGSEWSEGAMRVFRDHKVGMAAYVPEGGLRKLIARCHDEPSMTAVPLTNEAEGACVLAGAWLGGTRGVLLMQGSGVGNCINNFGLTIAGRFPLLTIVPLRGTWGEENSWMIYQGRTVERLLDLAGFKVLFVERTEDVEETLNAAAKMTFIAGGRIAVILSQRVTGAKQFSRVSQ